MLLPSSHSLGIFMAMPSATSFFAVAKKRKQKTLLGWLEQWLKEHKLKKLAKHVEKSTQAQRIKQVFAEPPSYGVA